MTTIRAGAAAQQPSPPAVPAIDTGLVVKTAAIGGATGSVAMFGALQVVDRTNRSSAAATAASQLLDVTNGKLRAGMLALGAMGIGAGVTDGAGAVEMDSTTRSLAIGGGIAALAAEGVHMGYSATFYPHGGAFKPLQMAENLTQRYHRINATPPEWIGIVKQVDDAVGRLVRRH